MTFAALLTTLRPQARQRALMGTLSAHVLHDGYTDLLYVMLPVWQAEFALSLAEVGLLKTAYSGVMAGLQVPASMLAHRFGERILLALGTAVAALGYLLAGWAGGFFGLAACLAIGGTGSSVQHPVGSSITARAYQGAGLRTALGTYNFSGDLGKMLFPAATAWLIATWSWRPATTAIAAAGFVTAIILLRLLPASIDHNASAAGAEAGAAVVPALPESIGRRAFAALTCIGILDSATRMGFLILLPFLLTAKGASLPTIGTSLTLVFAGGAAGKFVCGVIAERLGIIRTVVLTECATALGIVALLPSSLAVAPFVLPALGVALNGTSSVLYGTVAELVPAERRARAFGVFYTCTIGAGAISPSIYGSVSDFAGLPTTLVIVALVVLAVLPLTVLLRPALRLLRP